MPQAPTPALSEVASRIVRAETEKIVPRLVEEQAEAIKEKLFDELLSRISTEELIDAVSERYRPRTNHFGGLAHVGRIGADTVDFLSSGTSAVARTVQAKLREFGKSPEDFGAVGDGSTDDTTAVQAWISAVPTSAGGTDPGWIVRPTAGAKYKLSDKITTGNRRICMVGAGMTGSGSPSIFLQTNANKDFFDAYTGNSDVFSVYGCMFLGQGKGTGTGNAIRMGRAAQYIFDSQIKNNWFTSIPNACVYGDYIADVDISGNGIENSTYGVYIGTGAFASGDINKIQDNTFYSLTYGVWGASGTDLQIVSNQFNLCGTNPGGVGDDTSGAVVLNKNGSPSVRATLIATNTFRSNTNDVVLNGNGGVNASNTGVNDTSITGNLSDRAYRRFVLATDSHQVRVVNNAINSPGQETNNTYTAIDIEGTSDGAWIDGNTVSDQTGGATRANYGLQLGASTTNNKVGVNDFTGAVAPLLLNSGATYSNKQLLQGTWTPAVGGSATYTLQEGYWQKIGQLVFVQGKITINAIGSGSTSTISGLPFASFSAANSSVGSGSCSYFASLLSNVVSIVPVVVNNSATMQFTTLAAAGATATFGTAVFQNATRIDFSAVYLAA